jgi:hypothetical protein
MLLTLAAYPSPGMLPTIHFHRDTHCHLCRISCGIQKCVKRSCRTSVRWGVSPQSCWYCFVFINAGQCEGYWRMNSALGKKMNQCVREV